MKLDNLRIIFDGETTTEFTPGQPIAGRVLFTTSGFVGINSVRLKIKGEASTSWTDYVVDQQQIPAGLIGPHHRAVKYFANQVFFEKIIILVDFPENSRLKAGEHIYTFEFSLPDFLPSTYHDEFGCVQYTAKVTVDMLSDIDETKEIHFKVFSPYNLNNEPSLMEPKREEKLKSFSSVFFFVSGEIKIAVSVPYTGFVPGQIIPLTIELQNGSNVAINTVLVKLEKNLTFKANEPRLNAKFRSTVHDLLSFPGIECYTSRIWTKEIMIPNDLVVNNLNYCCIIDETFTLRVEAKSAAGTNLNTEVNMKIAMGNIPLTTSDCLS